MTSAIAAATAARIGAIAGEMSNCLRTLVENKTPSMSFRRSDFTLVAASAFNSFGRGRILTVGSAMTDLPGPSSISKTFPFPPPPVRFHHLLAVATLDPVGTRLRAVTNTMTFDSAVDASDLWTVERSQLVLAASGRMPIFCRGKKK